MRGPTTSAGAAVLLTALLSPAALAAQCNADNCYNQIARFSASAFCSAFTTATVTAVTGFPTFVSTSCGASRVSSACSCIYPPSACLTVTSTATVTVATFTTTKSVTATSTVTSTVTPVQTALDKGIIKNGVFGIDGWYNGDVVSSSSYGYDNPKLVQPGQASQWAV